MRYQHEKGYKLQGIHENDRRKTVNVKQKFKILFASQIGLKQFLQLVVAKVQGLSGRMQPRLMLKLNYQYRRWSL